MSLPVEIGESQKRSAGRAAVAEVSSGMRLGLGTGSTVRFFLEALAEGLSSGDLQDVHGVPTSVDTEARCRTLGIPTLALHEAGTLDLAVDGADEVSPVLDLVKGLGGALLREKMVVQASRRFVVVADASKEVSALGERTPIPVEVVPFGWEAHTAFFESLGAQPVARRSHDDDLVVTDNGNYIVDLEFPDGILDPSTVDLALHARAGLVETGLFLGFADRAFIGTSEGVRTRTRENS